MFLLNRSYEKRNCFPYSLFENRNRKKIQIGILLLVIYELLSLVDKASYLNR